MLKMSCCPSTLGNVFLHHQAPRDSRDGDELENKHELFFLFLKSDMKGKTRGSLSCLINKLEDGDKINH